MNKKYQVFVSSTYEDLKDERTAAISSLLDMDCIPVGMEQFPASSLSQWEYIKKMIDMSDYYLLIVAGKYGSIDPEEGISYTEKEYNYAKSKNIPILSILHEDIGKLLSEKVDSNQSKIKKFRQRVKGDSRLVDFYSNIDELKYKIAKAMPKIISDSPAIGWVRADEIETVSDSQDIAKTLDSFQKDFLKKIDEATPKWEEISAEKIKAIYNDNTYLISALSNEAQKLLVEASQDPNGHILVSKTFDGTNICTNGKIMNDDGNGMKRAIWEEAVNELVNNQLAALANGSKEVFKLTLKGYELAKQLSSST